MIYLHEAIIAAIEAKMVNSCSFSAWDITKLVREMELDPDDMQDVEVFVNSHNDCIVQVEHSRVKSLVHLYMKNYDPAKFKKQDTGRYIEYTPVGFYVDDDEDGDGFSINPVHNLPSDNVQGGTSYTLSDQELLSKAFDILRKEGIIK